MGIFHNEAFGGLAEDMLQPHGGHHTALDDLAQNVAGAHAGQLVGVAHHDDAAAMAQRRQQALEQLCIHHAHLVQHHHVTFEQVFLVVDKAQKAALGVIVHLQQPVDGLGLLARQFRQALGRTPRGRTESHPLPGMLQKREDGVHGGGLAGARPAGEHHDPAAHGRADGRALFFRVGKALGAFQNGDAPVHAGGRGRRMAAEFPQPGGDVSLGTEKVRQKNELALRPGASAHFAIIQQAVQFAVHRVRLDRQAFGGGPHQPFTRQAGVAVACVVAQDVKEARPHPQKVLQVHLQFRRDGVRLAEFQVQRFAAEDVGIAAYLFYRARAEMAVRLHRLRRRDAKAAQIGHRLPHAEHPPELV